MLRARPPAACGHAGREKWAHEHGECPLVGSVLEVCCAVLRCLLSFKQAPAGARATPVVAMATALVRDALQQGDRGEAAALLKRWQLPAAYAAFAGLTDGEQADLLKMLRQEGEQNLREQLAAAAGAAAGAPPPQPAPSTCTQQQLEKARRHKTHHQTVLYVRPLDV